MIIVRRVGAVALALAAVIIWFGMAPGDTAYTEYSSFVDQLVPSGDETYDLLRYVESNAAETSVGVLNLNEQAQTAAESDERLSALVGLGVVAVAFMTFTSSQRRDIAPPKGAPEYWRPER